MTDELPPPPEEVADLAQACIRFVHEALGLTLDYSAETLPILDHYLRQRASGAREEVLALIAPAAGAYFGEVVRRTIGGARWHAPEGDYPEYRIEFEPFFLCFNPLDVAQEVLSMTELEGSRANFQVLDGARAAVAQSLEATEGLPPEDYYTFSARFEALEQIASVLLALESQEKSPRSFGPEVYAATAGTREGHDAN